MTLKFQFSSSFGTTPIFSAALRIVQTLRANGKKAFFAGGCPRDMLLGKAPHDIDIATSALPDEIESYFPKTHAIGASFGVITVCEESFCFEVATLREERDYTDGRRPEKIFYTDDERRDVERRDFTVNGILYDPIAREMIDDVGGMADLHAGVLRTIGDPERRFSEDYLRILRAVRFSARLGFGLEPKTEEMLTKYAEKLSVLSKERIRSELEKILIGPRASDAFRLMRKTGILKVILPEVDALDGVKQSPVHHPEGDVFTHTMLMLDKMCHPTLELAWSVLLHDIGKPATFSIGEDGIIHFYSHEKLGSEMAEQLLLRLKCPSALVHAVGRIIAAHMKFAFVGNMKRSTWLKMIAEPTFPSEMELNRVDCASCHGKMEGYLLMLDRWIALGDRPPVPSLPVSGRDLIALGFSPGVKLGLLLGELKELFLEGRLVSREELLEYAKKQQEISKNSSAPILQQTCRKSDGEF